MMEIEGEMQVKTPRIESIRVGSWRPPHPDRAIAAPTGNDLEAVL